MSTLVLGDLHLKQPFILPRLLGYVRDPELAVGRVVFLGDACDDWGATERRALDALSYQADWVEARRSEGVRVDVLMGNHDLCYIRGRVGSGTMPGIMREVRDVLEDRLHVQMATTVGSFLCCHAGITQEWADEYLAEVDKTPADIAACLNAMLCDSGQWAALDSAGASRGGWQTPGPVWADVSDMLYGALADLNQIVGHTPIARAGKLGLVGWEDGCAPEIWACDTFSLRRSGTAIGDGSMVLVEDDGHPRRLAFPGEGGYDAVARAVAAQREL